MNTLSYRTLSINKESANKQWLIVDAEGEVLGRLASRVAKIIRGKHKTCYTPHADCGDNIIVVNAEKVKLTGTDWPADSTRASRVCWVAGCPGTIAFTA